MLRKLTELYAQRAREFANAVARLGRHQHIEPGLLMLVEEIKRKRDLCAQAEEEFLKYLQANR